MKSVSQPPNSVVKLYLPSEKAPAPPKPHLARHDGAAAAVNVGALVDGDHLKAGAAAHQLVSGENTGLAAAEDGNVIA